MDKGKHLSVATWNCQGIKTNWMGVKDLTKMVDVILLQEIWLEDWEGGVLQELEKGFSFKFISGMDPAREKNVGRPYGGVAILWNIKKVDYVGEVRFSENRRIINIELGFSGAKFNVINVYAPSDTRSKDDAFLIMEFWGQLNAEIESSKWDNVIIGGDFNTDYEREGNHLELLNDSLEENNLIIGDFKNEKKITYVSKINGATSWIDHFIVSKGMEGLLDSCEVQDNVMGSDHYPLKITLKIQPGLQQDLVKNEKTV